MGRHLTDREMTAHVLGVLEGEGLTHLAGCQQCRTEYARLRAALADLAVRAHAQAERSDAFFRTQRARIEARLGERPRAIRRWRAAWVPAVAAALLILILTYGVPRSPTPEDSAADQALLISVERAIQAEVPLALRPAGLLVADMERGLSESDGEVAVHRGDTP
jgi:anti-sigma factor RsiW